MRETFDKIINSPFYNKAVIDYGIVYGNNTIVFIKAGQNGSIYGYENKYLIMADTINRKHGYTVICSSNPFDGTNPLDNAMDIIDDYVKQKGFDDYVIYYMGTSNGATIGAQYGYMYPKIQRMLLVNAPLMINLHKTKEGIKKFVGEQMIMIYGDMDPSSSYIKTLDSIQKDNFRYYV
ncbi:MAG: alpha/beta hydrolase, partial [Clostridiales bacterium]|nr:alpha/beta hydrolase [Clostridiales bacterium]